MKEKIMLKIQAIKTCAELIKENYEAKEIRNSIPNLAVRVILETCKELLEELESEEKRD